MFAEQFAAPQYAHSATPMQYYQPTATGAGTVQIMNVPQSMPQPAAAPSAAVPYGAQLRGVGIKFGCDEQKHLIRKCPHNQYICAGDRLVGASCQALPFTFSFFQCFVVLVQLLKLSKPHVLQNTDF